HQTIFDAIVNHLDEVPGPGRSAVQVAIFRGARSFFPTGRPLHASSSGSQRPEDRVKPLYGLGLTADHQSIAALQAPHSTAHALVEEVNAHRLHCLRAPNVIDIIGVSSIDDDVVSLHAAREFFK